MRNTDTGTRERYWRSAIEDGPREARADAELRLGRFLLARGEREDGLELLGRAAEAADPAIASRASWALGEALLEEGEGKRAYAEFSRAAGGATTAHTPHVLLSCASRCSAQGEEDAAAGIYDRILSEATSAQDEVVATAAYRLAQLHLERRQFSAAIDLIRRVMCKGSAALRAQMLSDFADHLLEWIDGERRESETPDLQEGLDWRRFGEERGAEVRVLVAELYAAVIASEHADLGPRAAYLLAEIRLKQGESIAAEEGLRAVVSSAHPVYGPVAERRLEELEESESSEEVDRLISQLLSGEQLSLENAGNGEDCPPELLHPMHLASSCSVYARPIHRKAVRFVLVIHRADPAICESDCSSPVPRRVINPSDECCRWPGGAVTLLPAVSLVRQRGAALYWLGGGPGVRMLFGGGFGADPMGDERTVRFVPSTRTHEYT